jgi:hypothetical protein
MRALDLDLVRRSAAWPGWAVFAIALGVAVNAGLDYRRVRAEVEHLQRPLEAVEVTHAPAGEPLSEQTQRELEAARRLLQELVLPWDTLFRSIEDAVGSNTALLAIEPDAERRSVRITGEARDYHALLDFIVRLGETQGLTNIYPLHHQVRADVAERPFVFTLAANWGTAP